MKRTNLLILSGLLGGLALGGGVYAYLSSAAAPMTAIELVAEAKSVQLSEHTQLEAWTYGGTVPGQEIRVQEGNRVQVKLTNRLSEPTSIHWHGYPVPNEMDGIPGVTQDAVQPGASFTYEFTATVPGTYWYHSHQQSASQVDKGLYGTLIVEPKQPAVPIDRDFTLVLDEWIDPNSSMEMSHDEAGHDSTEQGGEQSHDDLMKQMYNLFTVNGTSGALIKPLDVQSGQRVKLRLVNAGFQTHLLHLPSVPFKVTDTDGQPIQNPGDLTDQLVAVAPGERYDLEFIAPEQSFWIDDHADSAAAADIMIPVRVNGQTPSQTAEPDRQWPRFNIAAYGSQTTVPEQTYTAEYKMMLDNKKDAQGVEKFTINGKIAPDIPPILVKKADRIKITFTNEGTADHPMHLHGHFFQVLSRNGQPMQDGKLTKDTLNVRPGETYEIALTADNEGIWMFHCHDLHHAAAGMMTELTYDGYRPDYTPDPNAHNRSE